MDFEPSSIQIVVKLFGHCPLESQELQLVYWVVPLSVTESPTSISYRFFSSIFLFLVQSRPQSSHGGVRDQFKRLVIICEGKYRGSPAQLFELFKSCFTLRGPLHFLLFLQIIFT